jgi:hypothetical protein
MKRTILVAAFLVVLAAGLAMSPAFAQTYSFRLDRHVVDVYIEADSTYRIEAQMTFTNDSGASPIDYVDVGVPTESYDLGSIQAWVNGQPVYDIQESPYVTPGVAIGLGPYAIPAGATGTVQVLIPGVRDVLYTADMEGYASALFSPTWFGSEYVSGSTDLQVTFHLPPGVQSEEPKYFTPQGGFASETPQAFYDSEDRVAYQWRDVTASPSTQYTFGAAFPTTYVAASAVQQPSFLQQLGVSEETCFTSICCVSFLALTAAVVGWAFYAERRRKFAYLPPKIAIEGHGIKRGLTAVEAGVLLETHLDRVLTMMLFSTVKKGAARVVTETPLKVEKLMPQPEGLQEYETAFMEAISLADPRDRQKKLEKVIVDLVKSVQAKMKGFSLKETREYYRSIAGKAWQEVEAAQTPEVKSEKYGDSIEWTMLDKDFDDRTKRTFQSGPVYTPVWWPNYRPSYSPTVSTVGGPRGSSGPSGPIRIGGPNLPSLPGADFAASVVGSLQTNASHMLTSLTGFTGNVTRVTNPPPPVTRSSGGGSRSSGGGHSCACACACAGCACACAGGGR